MAREKQETCRSRHALAPLRRRPPHPPPGGTVAFIPDIPSSADRLSDPSSQGKSQTACNSAIKFNMDQAETTLKKPDRAVSPHMPTRCCGQALPGSSAAFSHTALHDITPRMILPAAAQPHAAPGKPARAFPHSAYSSHNSAATNAAAPATPGKAIRTPSSG